MNSPTNREVADEIATDRFDDWANHTEHGLVVHQLRLATLIEEALAAAEARGRAAEVTDEMVIAAAKSAYGDHFERYCKMMHRALKAALSAPAKQEGSET